MRTRRTRRYHEHIATRNAGRRYARFCRSRGDLSASLSTSFFPVRDESAVMEAARDSCACGWKRNLHRGLREIASQSLNKLLAAAFLGLAAAMLHFITLAGQGLYRGWLRLLETWRDQG